MLLQTLRRGGATGEPCPAYLGCWWATGRGLPSWAAGWPRGGWPATGGTAACPSGRERRGVWGWGSCTWFPSGHLLEETHTDRVHHAWHNARFKNVKKLQCDWTGKLGIFRWMFNRSFIQDSLPGHLMTWDAPSVTRTVGHLFSAVQRQRAPSRHVLGYDKVTLTHPDCIRHTRSKENT